MTEKLYLADSYLRECTARVVHADGTSVVLDKTVFYPQGGGQPGDTGKILCNEKELCVVAVRHAGSAVAHELDRGALVAGNSVRCILDWKNRYTYMRMHTTAHILARVISVETGALITGNQLGLQETRMDFDLPGFESSLIRQFEEKTNEIISQGLAVSISFLPAEEAMKNPQLVRLKNVMPRELQEWRIVSIGDFDVQADGGTHVKNTREIGRMKITQCKNKGANNRRLYFELE